MPGMPSIGDIANDVARTLYENRVAVAIASLALLVVAVLVARRLGWFAAARRHPGRTAGLVGVALVVLLPTAWYLGSPIFIRTSLVEASPVEAAAAPSASPAGTLEPSTSPVASAVATATPSPTPSPTPFAALTVATGEFQGTDDFHYGSGTASIIEIEPGRFHLRLEDFSVRNGPDLYVYLSPSPDDWTEDALELGLLKATDGSFGYDLPAGADPGLYRSAIIWCKQFSQLFATAPFES